MPPTVRWLAPGARRARNEHDAHHDLAAGRAAAGRASTGGRATPTIHRVVEEISSARRWWLISDQWEDAGRHAGVGPFGLVPHQPGATAVLRNHSASHDPQRPRVSRGRCAPHAHIRVLTWSRHHAPRPLTLCTVRAPPPRSVAAPRTRACAVREIVDTLTLAMRQHACEDVVCVVNMTNGHGASPFALPYVAGFVVSHRCRWGLKKGRRGRPQPCHTPVTAGSEASHGPATAQPRTWGCDTSAPSLCTHSAPTLHRLCIHSAPSLHDMCSHSASNPLHPLCTHSAPSLHPLCTIGAPTLHPAGLCSLLAVPCACALPQAPLQPDRRGGGARPGQIRDQDGHRALARE